MNSSANTDVEGRKAPGPVGVGAISTRRPPTAAFAAGDILIERSAHLPVALLRSESGPDGWAAVKDPRPTFEKQIAAEGWTLFFMAGEMKTTVFGSDRQKTLRTAMQRLIANVKSQNYNSIEITQVTNKSFLKMPYVSVSAHARHVQKGLVFSGRR